MDKVEEILKPTIDRLYRWNLPEGAYKEIVIKASIGMLLGTLSDRIYDALYTGDEKGLLSPESIEDIRSHPENYMGDRQEVIREGLIAEAQQSLTRREGQERVERLISKIEYQLMKQGKDKLSIYREVWQALKKQEGL